VGQFEALFIFLQHIARFAGRNINHALCPLVQVARAFGGLGHLMLRHFATYLSSISFASLLASRRVA
jgi:hypothetical protein